MSAAEQGPIWSAQAPLWAELWGSFADPADRGPGRGLTPRPGPRSQAYGSEPALKGSVPSASETPLKALLAFM